MKKLDMKSMDITQDNIAKIKALFPSAVTEVMGDDGKVKLAIDFDALKQELSDDLISDKQERYQMTWPDKSKAKVLANSRITATLRPDKEKSVDFDNTENLYIEGDNLDVLKLLRETYLGKVKMIYIDPPYNTGNDFVYEDDFAMSADDYAEVSGQYDEQGNRLVKNLDSNGRFHTDWLNMIYPRLKVARDLLSDDGAIFISIDDNEVENLKKLCDEVFGENKFVATFPWRKRTAKSDVPFGVSQDYEWLVCYAKTSDFTASIEGKERKYYETPDFPGRPWRVHDLTKQTTASERPNSFFTIVNPKNGKTYPANPNRTWAITEETFKEYYSADRIVFPGEYDFLNISKPVLRYWKSDDMAKAGDSFGRIAVSTKLPEDIGMSQDGTKEITELLETKVFSFPKTVKLLKYILQIINDDSALILDFFSGSATTAHAVMQLNAEGGGKRKFIMVQLPEKCDEKSEAYKAGYKTICDIGEERIRRAGKKIVEELKVCGQERKIKGYTLLRSGYGGAYQYAQWKNDETGEIKTESRDVHEPNDFYKYYPNELDIGFRVLKLDSSNMQEVYYNPVAMTQDLLASTVDNVKADRTPLDLLFQVMLDLGIELSAKIEEHTVSSKTYYTVNSNDIIACFDDNIDNDVIVAIAKQNPLYAVFKDKSFATDSVGINNEQLFKTYSPSTVVKVI